MTKIVKLKSKKSPLTKRQKGEILTINNILKKKGIKREDYYKNDILYIGVDPGAKGRIVCVNDQKKCINYFAFPTNSWDAYAIGNEINILLANYGMAFALIEDVIAIPGTGIIGRITSARNLGVVLGVFTCLSILHKTIHCSRWQNLAKLGLEKCPLIKDKSITKAMRDYPDLANKIAIDDGLADALNIATVAMSEISFLSN